MGNINKFYGILANGCDETVKGYRMSDCNRNLLSRNKRKMLDTLVPEHLSSACLAYCANTLIALMQTSEYWHDAVQKYDPINTYMFDVEYTAIDTQLQAPECDIDRMSDIAVRLDLTDNRYPVAAWFAPLDYLVNTCFILLSEE